jgi:protein ImuA
MYSITARVTAQITAQGFDKFFRDHKTIGGEEQGMAESHLVAALRAQLERLESARRRAAAARDSDAPKPETARRKPEQELPEEELPEELEEGAGELVSSGCAALDGCLPAGGFRRGTLVEWLGGAGGGAGLLALLTAREAARQGGAVVILDRQRRFYPPAAAAWGLDLKHLIVVRAANRADELWALDQSLRCRAVAAAWAPLDHLDPRWFRRLQLAAEETGTLGLLLRPRGARGRPSWSDVQLLVTPRGSPGSQPGEPKAARWFAAEESWRLQLQLTRCRGARAGKQLELEVVATTGMLREADHHETLPVSLAAPLAHPAVDRREARA